MFVGEVRCATMSLGTTCRLSGGRWWSSAPTMRSNRRQVSRPTSWSRARSSAESAPPRWRDRGRLTHHVHSGDIAQMAQSSVADTG